MGERLKSWPDQAVGLTTRRKAQEQNAAGVAQPPVKKQANSSAGTDQNITNVKNSNESAKKTNQNEKQKKTPAAPLSNKNGPENKNTKGEKAKAGKQNASNPKPNTQPRKPAKKEKAQGQLPVELDAERTGEHNDKITDDPAHDAGSHDSDHDGVHTGELGDKPNGEKIGEPDGEKIGEPDKKTDEPEKKTDEPTNKKTPVDSASESDASDKEGESAPEDPTAKEKWQDLDFDLTFLDDDMLAAALDSADEELEGSAPGPLPAHLNEIWQRYLARASEFVIAFSKVSRKMPDVLYGMVGEWFKLTRNPNIYNMWVKQWSLLNAMEEGESKGDYHRRYVNAYHEKVDNMTAAEKQQLRVELLNWLHSYEKECADEAKLQGVGFKGMLDGKRAMIRAAQTVARRNNCVVWGVIVPQDVSDAKMIASGGSFSSHDGMNAVMKEYGVNSDDLCGTIASIFGAKRVADRLINNWTDEALAIIANKPEKDRRYWLRRLLLAIQNRALPIPSDKLDWKGNASCCIRRKIWYDQWPAGVDPPDVVGDNKYLEAEHNKLMEAGYKTMRNEPGYPHIQVKAFTDEQLSWRRTDWKRWCALPVYRDTNGKVLISVGDVMPSEEMDIKLKGRVSRKRFTGSSNTTEDDNTKTGPKRPRRSVEDYDNLLIGGGSDEAWDVKPPPPKRHAPTRPDYVHVEEMDVDRARSPSAGPSERSQSAQPGGPSLALEMLQQQMIAAQRQQFMQQQQMTNALQQLMSRASAQPQQMANINWSLPPLLPMPSMTPPAQQQQQQQQQQQLPPIHEWMADGQGGFLPFNGN